MGMTLTTLHLYGVERGALTPLLAPDDLLREQNAPWLSVVPTDGPPHTEARERLEKLAKRLTRGRDQAAALVFFYFDDERFCCEYIRSGRKKTVCLSNESWAKLGKELNALFEDEAPGKAFRYASRCFDLQEQVRLLEETVGTALYDIPEEEPRRVPRGDGTLREIKAREAALRKRPNQYVLTELPPEEWPDSVRAKRQLYELLRPQWDHYHVSRLLYEIGKTSFVIPHHPSRLVHPYNDEAHTDHLILYDGASGEIADWSFPGAIPLAPLWRTKDGALVFLFAEIEREIVTETIWTRSGGREYVRCLEPDGSERWHFVPEMNKHQNLQHVCTSADGIVTLLAGMIDGEVKADALIFQLDGESGRLLRSRRVPAEDDLCFLCRAEELDAFVYHSRTTGKLVLLNDELEEKARWSGFKGSGYIRKEEISGSLIWVAPYWDNNLLYLHDLRDGTVRKTRLEIPALVLARLSDGRLLGVSGNDGPLTVFDSSGTVVARCRAPGMLPTVWQETDRICIVQIRGPDSHGLVSPETLDAMSVHVWRLDPA